MLEKINKIGLTTPEDIMYDDSYTKDFLEFLDSIKSKEVKNNKLV